MILFLYLSLQYNRRSPEGIVWSKVISGNFIPKMTFAKGRPNPRNVSLSFEPVALFLPANP